MPIADDGSDGQVLIPCVAETQRHYQRVGSRIPRVQSDTMQSERRSVEPRITAEAIERIVDTIAGQFDPERIILFGSRARGTCARTAIWISSLR